MPLPANSIKHFKCYMLGWVVTFT